MEFFPCRKCVKGYIYNEDEVSVCNCLIEYRNKLENEIAINNSNLPKSIQNYTLENYIGKDENKNLEKIKKYINEFETKFKNISFFVSGNNATQKTTLIGYLGREIAKNGFSVSYCTMNEMIKDITNAPFKEGLDEKLLNYYEDLLIIDESFSLDKVTLYQSGYQIPFLFDFLKERIERHKKATIFISNTNMKNIDNRFSISLKSLIERNCSELVFTDSINIKNSFNPEDMWK